MASNEEFIATWHILTVSAQGTTVDQRTVRVATFPHAATQTAEFRQQKTLAKNTLDKESEKHRRTYRHRHTYRYTELTE